MRRLLPLVLLILCVGVPAANAAPVGSVTTVASGLDTPWEILPLPDGRTLVTERPGRVRVIDADGTLRAAPVYADAGARKFLGLALHPQYATNRLVYLYVSRPSGNSVVRLVDRGDRLDLDRTVFERGIGTDGNHDGGRMRFGPDGRLYVTTGDIHNPALPQDRQSLNGKILRMNDDGSAPSDNPFVAEGGNAAWVWSYGHRHPQGLEWDSEGRLWETEHGPSGEQYGAAYPGGDGRCCRDELNLVERGANYGWPLVSGSDERAGMRSPVAYSGDSTVWAPGGLAFAADGTLYAPLLAGSQLRAFSLAGTSVASQTALYTGYGRLRVATYDACREALWFAEDKTSANVYRVAIDRGGRPPLRCPSATVDPSPSDPGGPETPPVDTAPPSTPPAEPSASARLRDRLLSRLRSHGLRHFRARGVDASAGGFGRGRLVVRISRVRAGTGRTVARFERRVTTRASVRVRLRTKEGGRRILRGASRIRLRVVVGFQPSGGRMRTESGSVVVGGAIATASRK